MTQDISDNAEFLDGTAECKKAASAELVMTQPTSSVPWLLWVDRDPGAAAYDAQRRQRVIHRLRQRAANLGFALVNRETGEVIEGTVS